MILGGTLMLPSTEGTVRLAQGTVEVKGSKIVAVCEAIERGSPDFGLLDRGSLDRRSLDRGSLDLGGEDSLICPGFVDTHLHLPQFDSIGIDGLELLEWLDTVIFPAEARWEDPDYAGTMTERVLDQLAAFGTTSFAAYATVHHEATKRALEVIASRGVRAMVGQVLMDRHAPPELLRPARQLIAEAAALEPSGRVEVAVTPRFAVSCTPNLLAACGDLAQKTGWAVQTHLAETLPECRLIGKLFGGETYTAVYEQAGLLGPRSLLAHGIWLSEQERSLLAKTQSIIAHCPTANLFLEAGSHDRALLQQSGVRVSLGSDVAGGPDRSMVRVGRAMIETAKNRGAPPPRPAEAWWQITRGNAEILGWQGVGSLHVGAEADLLVIRPTTGWTDSPDPLGTLLYSWDDRWLRKTLVHGRVVYEAGESPVL